MSDIELPPNLAHLRKEKGLKKFKPGDVVYFKRIKETSAPHGRYQEWTGGCGFGILLGVVPDKMPDPPQQLLLALMAQHGWMTFDDVIEVFGPELGQKALAHVTKKYFKPEASTPKTTIITPGDSDSTHGNS